MAQQFRSRLKVSKKHLFCFIKTCVRCCDDAFMLKVSVVGDVNSMLSLDVNGEVQIRC